MKAVCDDYKPRSMEVLCQEALEILRASASLMRCSFIGEQLFRDATFRGSCPFARIAGKVVRRLREAGLAEIQIGRGGHASAWGWSVTCKGRRTDYTIRKVRRLTQ